MTLTLEEIVLAIRLHKLAVALVSLLLALLPFRMVITHTANLNRGRTKSC